MPSVFEVMMKTLLSIIFLLIFQVHCKAAERKVVILTSVKNPTTIPFWRAKDYQIEKDIEMQFKNYFSGSGYKIIFIHKATAANLEYSLLSPNTLALFWVSHAAKSQTILNSIILDIAGNNVKEVFKNVHPSLRFLSLVGCQSRHILDKYLSQGQYTHAKKLVTHGFKKTVSLNKAIRKSVVAASKVLDKDPQSFYNLDDYFVRSQIIGIPALMKIKEEIKQIKRGFAITIKNTNINYSAQISVGDSFIGLLKKGSLPQVFFIPYQSMKNNHYKLKVSYENAVLELEQPLLKLDIYKFPENFVVEPRLDPDYQMYGRKTNFYYLRNIKPINQ